MQSISRTEKLEHAIEVGIWRLGSELTRVEFSPLASEAKLEDTLAADLSVLSPGLMPIGEQVPTAFGKFIDPAMESEGKPVLIELKRDNTPRDVVAGGVGLVKNG